MEGITHRKVEVNGISMHVVEKGREGPVVLLLHGFPELWYSWRHQIAALAAAGYRAVAPDLRGFGGTTVPPSQADYSIFHIVADLVALIESLGEDQVFVVGHDWGALVAWYLCMFRPDKVKALVNLSVAFSPRNSKSSALDYYRTAYGEAHYILEFQEPGRAEKIFAEFGVDLGLKMFFSYINPGPLFLVKELTAAAEENAPLPSWLSEQDFGYFVSEFDRTGFTGGFNYYRNLDRNWELTGPWSGPQIKVPTKFIVGDLDLTYNALGVKDFVHNGGLKRFVPLLEEVVVMEGVGHFPNQVKPSEVNDHILDFFGRF